MDHLPRVYTHTTCSKHALRRLSVMINTQFEKSPAQMKRWKPAAKPLLVSALLTNTAQHLCVVGLPTPGSEYVDPTTSLPVFDTGEYSGIILGVDIEIDPSRTSARIVAERTAGRLCRVHASGEPVELAYNLQLLASSLQSPPTITVVPEPSANCF